MRTLRAATVIAICLWLVLPGTSTFAFCIDHHGSVALEVAVGDACARSEEDGGSRSPERTVAMEAPVIHCCGDCTDVVLRGAEDAVPTGDASTKQSRERSADEIDQASSLSTNVDLLSTVPGRRHQTARTSDPHHTTGFTVLRL